MPCNDDRPDGLISGIFLDDDISATGGFAENCDLGACEHDMGLTSADMQALQAGWADMMNRTQVAFAWCCCWLLLFCGVVVSGVVVT